MKATATTVHRLIQGSKVFLIPAFQRRYTWKKDQWDQLWSDLINEYAIDHPDDPDTLHGHFLGSIVLHPAPGPASTLMRHQVIDGQQRLTTILLLLAALRDVRTELEPAFNPASIEHQYLANPYSAEYPDRLVPTKLDREAYVRTVREGKPAGDLGIAYGYFRDALMRSFQKESLNFDRLQTTLLLHMLLVEINTKAGDSVNSIFNTLNSKGMDLSAADLVRNEVLHHIGEELADSAHEQYWIPMETTLVSTRAKVPDREFVTFLWAREVAISPKTSRDSLFSHFERRLRGQLGTKPPAEQRELALAALREMYDDHILFRIVRDPQFGADDARISPKLLDAMQRLNSWRSEPTTPIALWILKSAATGKIDQDDAAEAIHVLLSYLVRRILQGIPTNQLNRLLTPVAAELAGRPPGTPVRDALRASLSKPGYYWPTDDQVRAAVVANPVYASARRYVKFLLSAAERRAPGFETADLSKAQIDHVMPQRLSSQWVEYLRSHSADIGDAEALVHTLGNLTLTENNQKMGNGLFEQKRSQFFRDSAVRLNRQLAERDDFLPAAIRERSVQLAEYILSEYPHTPLGAERFSEDDAGASAADRLEALLQTMPIGHWVTEEALVSVLGATSTEIRRIVNDLASPPLARLIRGADGARVDWLKPDLAGAVEEQDSTQPELQEPIAAEELQALIRAADGDSDEETDEQDL